MPRAKIKQTMPKSSARVQRILRVVARIRRTSGVGISGYTVMLPFSRRLTRNSANKISATTRDLHSFDD